MTLQALQLVERDDAVEEAEKEKGQVSKRLGNTHTHTHSHSMLLMMKK